MLGVDDLSMAAAANVIPFPLCAVTSWMNAASTLPAGQSYLPPLETGRSDREDRCMEKPTPARWLPFTETSYQTVPLVEYSQGFRDRATALFRLVTERVGAARAKEHKGSFSVLAASSDATAAKIIIYEAAKGKVNGLDPQLADGIYVLIRVHGTAGCTIGVAPMHHERFAYFRLLDGQGLEEIADFVAACAGAQ
jgi:hypothetical protein